MIRLIEGDGDDRVRPGRDHRFDAIPIGQRPTDEPVGRLERLRVVVHVVLLSSVYHG